MQSVRTLLCATVLLFAASETAAGEPWRIVQSAGPVRAGGASFTPAGVQVNQPLPGDAWVETGAAGRVVLVRGLETIAVGPNSRVLLPTEEVNGNTQVLQTLGSALYQVGKQKAPHFQVDTPYLAAVVKGTTFTVTVTEEGSSVDVTEGLVKVETPDGSDSEFVQPGFSGVVTKNDISNVVVMGGGHDGPGLPGDAPAGDKEKGEKSDTSSNDGANNGKGAVITAAIGEVVLDVKEVSGGLATSGDVPGVGEPEKERTDSSSDGKSDTVAEVEVGGEASDTHETGGPRSDDSLADAGSGKGITEAPVDVTIDLGPPGNGNGNGHSVGVDLGVSEPPTVDLGAGNGNGGGGAKTPPGNGNGNGKTPPGKI